MSSPFFAFPFGDTNFFVNVKVYTELRSGRAKVQTVSMVCHVADSDVISTLPDQHNMIKNMNIYRPANYHTLSRIYKRTSVTTCPLVRESAMGYTLDLTVGKRKLGPRGGFTTS